MCFTAVTKQPDCQEGWANFGYVTLLCWFKLNLSQDQITTQSQPGPLYELVKFQDPRDECYSTELILKLMNEQQIDITNNRSSEMLSTIAQKREVPFHKGFICCS